MTSKVSQILESYQTLQFKFWFSHLLDMPNYSIFLNTGFLWNGDTNNMYFIRLLWELNEIILSTFYDVWNIADIQSLLLSLFSEISLSSFTICRFKSIPRSALIKKSISWVGLLLFTSVYGVELKNKWSNIIISHSKAGMTLGILERSENFPKHHLK